MKKKVSKRTLIGLTLISSLLVLTSCKKQEQIQSPVKPVVQVKTAAKVVPVQKQVSSVTVDLSAQYDFKNKKDPFKPFVIAETVTKSPQVKTKNVADLLPIQSYDVSKFKISGIIVGLKENKALLIDPTGKGYVVKEGMLIGSNDGHITKITPSSIEILERYREENGTMRTRKTVLTLAKKK